MSSTRMGKPRGVNRQRGGLRISLYPVMRNPEVPHDLSHTHIRAEGLGVTLRKQKASKGPSSLREGSARRAGGSRNGFWVLGKSRAKFRLPKIVCLTLAKVSEALRSAWARGLNAEHIRRQADESAGLGGRGQPVQEAGKSGAEPGEAGRASTYRQALRVCIGEGRLDRARIGRLSEELSKENMASSTLDEVKVWKARCDTLEGENFSSPSSPWPSGAGVPGPGGNKPEAPGR